MAKGSEIPKVSEKNTKTEILEAFSTVVSKLEAQGSTRLDPMAEGQTLVLVGKDEKIDTYNQERQNDYASYLRFLRDYKETCTVSQ